MYGPLVDNNFANSAHDQQCLWKTNLSITFAGLGIELKVTAFSVEGAGALLALDPVDAHNRVVFKVGPDDLILATICPHSLVFSQR